MRKIISKYFKIIYQSELLGPLNGNGYYSVDESLINHYQGHQVWLLGIRDNNNKDFRVEGSFKRDTRTMEAFITNYVEKGNHIVTDGWEAYDFLDKFNSGYIRHKHIHGNGDFGLGQESTSYVESLWGLLKAKLKECYHSVPANIFMLFVKEQEFKIKYNNLSFEERIDKFFEAFNLSEEVEDVYLKSSFNYFIPDNLDNYNSGDEDIEE